MIRRLVLWAAFLRDSVEVHDRLARAIERAEAVEQDRDVARGDCARLRDELKYYRWRVGRQRNVALAERDRARNDLHSELAARIGALDGGARAGAMVHPPTPEIPLCGPSVPLERH